MTINNPSLVLQFLGNDLPAGHSTTPTISNEYIINHSISFSYQLMSNLKSSSNQVKLQISRDCGITEDIIATDGDILATLKDGYTVLFTGFISTNFSWNVTQSGEQALSITLEDKSSRLLTKCFISTGHHLFDCEAHQAIEAVCLAAGISISILAETIHDRIVKVVDSSATCRDILDQMLYELGYVYYCDNLGELRFWKVDCTSVSGIPVLDKTKLYVSSGSAISLSKKIRQYRSVRVTFTEVGSADHYLVYRNTTNQADGIPYCQIELNPGEHFDGLEIYTEAEWAAETADEFREDALIEACNADSESKIVGSNKIISISNVEPAIDRDSGITATITAAGGPYLKVDAGNPTGTTKTISRLDAYASIIYEKSQNIIRTGISGNNTDSLLSEEVSYIHTKDLTTRHANLLCQYYAYCNSQYTFFSKEDLEPGDLVHINENVWTGLGVDVLITAKTVPSMGSVIKYTAIGISVFDLDKDAYHRATDAGKQEVKPAPEAVEESSIIVPEGYEVVTQYAFGELEKGAERWLADHDGSEDHRVWDKDSWVADLMWVDANEDGSCPLRPRAGMEIWKRQGIREGGSSEEPQSWEVTLYNVVQSFSFTSTSFVFDRNTRSLDGDGYSVVGLVIDMQGQYGKLTLVTSAGVIGIAVDGVVTPLSSSVSIDIPARERVTMTNYLVMLPNNVNTKSVFVRAIIGSVSDPRAYMSITLSTKDEAAWAYLGLFTQDEISSYGTGGPTDATGKIMLGDFAGKQVVEGDIFVIKGINALNAEFLDIMTFINGNWDYLSSHEDDDPEYDEKLMVLAPEVYSGNVDSTLLPSNFSFIENLVSKHVTAEFIGAKRIKLISTRDKLGAIYAGDVDFTREHGKRVTSAKGFVLDGNGDAEIKNLDVAGNSFIHGDCTVGGTIANKVQDTDESVFFTNKDAAAAVAWGTTRNTDTRAVSKNGMVGLLASLCSGSFRSASGYVNPRGIHNYQVYGVFMHPTSGSAAAYSASQNCPRNQNNTDTLTFLIPGYIPQSLFTVSWTAKWSDSANFVGWREVNRGSVTYSITNSRTGKNVSGTLMYADAADGWIGESALTKSGSTTLIMEGGDTLSLTFGARGYAYSVYQNGNGHGSASITYAASNYSASEYDGGRDIAPAGAGNHVRGIIYFVVNENNSASGARVALSFNSEIPSPSDGNRQDLLGRSFFELRDMDSATYDTGQFTAPFPFTSGLIINNSTVNLSALDYYYKIQAPTFSGSGTVSSAMLALKSSVFHNDYSSIVNYGSTDIAVVTMSATMVKLALNNTNTIEMTTSGYYQLGAGFYIDIETLSSLKGSFAQNMMPIYNHDSSGNPTTRVGTANVGTQAEKWASVWAEYVNGNASSRKNKHDVAAFKGNALEILMRTLVVSFVYNKDIEPSGLTRYGFIAEDAPAELATERHDIMDEGSCIGIIIKAMQELYAELQELRRKS